jgi:hypothetical protein
MEKDRHHSLVITFLAVDNGGVLFKQREEQATFSIKDWCQEAKSNILISILYSC